jgi:hypothetical protein
MIPIAIQGGWVLFHSPNALLVHTKLECTEALKCGKACCRRQALTQRPSTHGADGAHLLPTAPCRSGTCRSPNATETTRLHRLVEHV